LKEILIELEGVYHHTHIRTGAISPVDYSALARGIEESEAYFATAGSQASNFSIERGLRIYGRHSQRGVQDIRGVGSSKREQFDMIRAQ